LATAVRASCESIALTSVMQYKQSSKIIEQIGKELHADFLLEGSIGGQ
jgi:TolB-like protein